ncbi:hypothetical protein AAFF_G00096160 [Aldrovandia affinis]|uniref:Uncharacterized protein n=1 Tax=Aldrovandia affinis TaxID=143900 RepID=A0AAD7RVS2_9TELE|nr:hypothetical protein AAFF_G00096160 [Aldrovandia affinis]
MCTGHWLRPSVPEEARLERPFYSIRCIQLTYPKKEDDTARWQIQAKSKKLKLKSCGSLSGTGRSRHPGPSASCRLSGRLARRSAMRHGHGVRLLSSGGRLHNPARGPLLGWLNFPSAHHGL